MKRIGFLTANLHIGSSRALWPGLADAAERLNTNLVCYVGGSLGGASGSPDLLRNNIYQLVNPTSLDGLISWTSTVGGSASPAELQAFHQRFHSLPALTLAHLDGFPEIAVDSYQGMRAAIQHLVETHNYRKLAFVRGPERHYYAQERYHAYCDALEHYGIAYDPRLVTPPLPWDGGAQAAALLLDERGLLPGRDFQAVLAVSDLPALAVMQILQGRGCRIPQDVAVIGLNDTTEGRLSFPPLTSVALPFYQQGARALEIMAAHTPGRPLPERTLLASHLVVRQSCGCPSPGVVRARADDLLYRGHLPPAAWPQLVDEIMAELGPQAAQAGCGRQMLLAMLAALDSPLQERFLALLEDLLDQASNHRNDITSWQTVISALRRATLPHIAPDQRTAAEDLFGQSRVLISEKAQRALAYQQLQAEQQANLLRTIGQELITTFDMSRLADVLARRLPQVGIPGCYIALYQEPKKSLEQAGLVIACTSRGLAVFGQGGLPFAARQLLPDDILSPDRRVSLVVQPLFFDNEPIGFVTFEVGTRSGEVYEALRGHLSSALKGTLLLKDARRARAAAEKADAIKTRLLANVSHELRAPLNIIIERAQRMQQEQPSFADEPDVRQIEQYARHQLRVINDLLDLSRAEIDELDLYREMLDPRPLLVDAYHSLAGTNPPGSPVTWQLALPARLPQLHADPLRLRQVLLNLLSNAAKYTQQGQITLGAEVLPPHLHIWVSDTGPGIPSGQQELIFEPFVTLESGQPHATRARTASQAGQGGIGLGLSITRRLVALHHGMLTVESQPGVGSTFHVYLPLPTLENRPPQPHHAGGKSLLLLSSSRAPAEEIQTLCQRAGLEICRVDPTGDLDALLETAAPVAIAWDLASAQPAEWRTAIRLRNHPRCSQTPFLLYGQAGAQPPGLTGFVTRAPVDLEHGPAAAEQNLFELIEAACPSGLDNPILVVDDDDQARSNLLRLLTDRQIGLPLETAADGQQAVQWMEKATPSLVILDLMMPEMDGFAVLDWMRAQPRLRSVPVMIISSKLLSQADVRRLEKHALVRFQSKGLLSDDELDSLFRSALAGSEVLPPQTSALVKQALAFIHQHYARPLARWEIAQAAGASEDYLGRIFHRELGLSPWDYLTRCRVQQAKDLLLNTALSVQAIARQVGFKDAAYFSRVFSKQCGASPAEFRKLH